MKLVIKMMKFLSLFVLTACLTAGGSSIRRNMLAATQEGGLSAIDSLYSAFDALVEALSPSTGPGLTPGEPVPVSCDDACI